MAEKEVRKTTRKRTVRKTTAKKAPLSASERKAPATARKAPLRTQEGVQKKDGSGFRVILIGVVLFLMLLGISAAIGYSDKGSLNVEQTITLRKESATPAEKQALENVPTEQSKVANGGLVGAGQSAPTPSVVQSVATSSTATTTPSNTSASSTASSPSDAEHASTSMASTSTDTPDDSASTTPS